MSRQLDLLAPDHDVVAAGFSAPKRHDLTYIELPTRRKKITGRLLSVLRLLTRRYDSYYWSVDSVACALNSLKNRTFDLIIANEADTWPLARALAKTSGARLLFDAHEYTPRELEDVLSWRLVKQPYRTALCHRHLPAAHSVITVCDGIADEYARVFSIPRPLVVRNAPAYADLGPSPTQHDDVRMIHHGAASPSRKIETMIAMMGYLDDRFSLDLMLVAGDPAYHRFLRSRAADHPRVRFLDPVAPDQIIATTRAYDIGLFLLPPTNFNYRHALPNKFFEFVQARLAIAIGPSPEMSRLVREHHLGIVSADFTPRALAASLNSLTSSQIDAFKDASHAASAVLSWDHERETLRREVARLLALPPCVA